MNAPFKVGDRVKMADAFACSFVRLRAGSWYGEIVAVIHDQEVVRVKRDGLKAVLSYHWKLWKSAEAEKLVVHA